MAGILYICATPIGNLSDMTPRAIEILRIVDLIAAEDTRHTLRLLNYFAITNKLFSYHEHNKVKQGPVLIEELQKGKNIALVSDAGFPGISDPGEDLVKLAIAENITVIPIPGANALLCALVASGLRAEHFFYGGFLPKTGKKRREQLFVWKIMPTTTIFYEAPHRIVDTLKDILKVWGDRQVVLARELTKIHEEFFRGTISSALERFSSGENPRGEYTIVLASADESGCVATEVENLLANNTKSLPEEVAILMAQGIDKKQAITLTAKKLNIAKREVYQSLLTKDVVTED